MNDDQHVPLAAFVDRAKAAAMAARPLAGDVRPLSPDPEDPANADLVSQGPSMRVRAVMKDGAIFVHLRDLMGYVTYPLHDVNRECQDMIASLLERLGEALES